MMNNELKQCSNCKEYLTLDKFKPMKYNKCGLTSRCRVCINIYQKELLKNRSEEAKQKHSIQKSEWYIKNRDIVLKNKKINRDSITNNNLTKSKERNLRKSFGLTPTDYLKMLKDQNNVCAICGQPEKAKHKSGKIRYLSVDHNHETGKVRGLLCASCNTAIGLLKENINVLENAIIYLKSKI